MSGDQPHKANNNTKPRTKTRFSDIGSGEHLMSIDIMVEPGSNGTVVHQFKSAGTRPPDHPKPTRAATHGSLPETVGSLRARVTAHPHEPWLGSRCGTGLGPVAGLPQPRLTRPVWVHRDHAGCR